MKSRSLHRLTTLINSLQQNVKIFSEIHPYPTKLIYVWDADDQ